MIQYQLIDDKTKQPLLLGTKVTTFRGEKAILTAFYPPHRPGVSGKVLVKRKTGGEDLIYASVIGAEYIEVEPIINLPLTEGELHMIRLALDRSDLKQYNEEGLRAFADLRNKLAIAAHI